jgi:ATP-dependent DNA ligase
MPSAFIPPCIPTRAYKVPAGPDCVHEIKHDGYRLQVRRDGEAIRLVKLYSLAASRPAPWGRTPTPE